MSCAPGGDRTLALLGCRSSVTDTLSCCSLLFTSLEQQTLTELSTCRALYSEKVRLSITSVRPAPRCSSAASLWASITLRRPFSFSPAMGDVEGGVTLGSRRGGGQNTDHRRGTGEDLVHRASMSPWGTERGTVSLRVKGSPYYRDLPIKICIDLTEEFIFPLFLRNWNGQYLQAHCCQLLCLPVRLKQTLRQWGPIICHGRPRVSRFSFQPIATPPDLIPPVWLKVFIIIISGIISAVMPWLVELRPAYSQPMIGPHKPLWQTNRGFSTPFGNPCLRVLSQIRSHWGERNGDRVRHVE